MSRDEGLPSQEVSGRPPRLAQVVKKVVMKFWPRGGPDFVLSAWLQPNSEIGPRSGTGRPPGFHPSTCRPSFCFERGGYAKWLWDGPAARRRAAEQGGDASGDWMGAGTSTCTPLRSRMGVRYFDGGPMIGFRVRVNQDRVVTIGLDGDHSVSVTITAADNEKRSPAEHSSKLRIGAGGFQVAGEASRGESRAGAAAASCRSGSGRVSWRGRPWAHPRRPRHGRRAQSRPCDTSARSTAT